jgi:hypothetical protein
MFLITAAGTGWRMMDRSGQYESRIEFEGGRNPEEFGFQSRLDLIEHAVSNPERTGFDHNGWKIEATFKPVQGGGGVGVDLSPADGRYDVNVMVNGGWSGVGDGGSGRRVSRLSVGL